MLMKVSQRIYWDAALFCLSCFLTASRAHAVPSFSRQTGLPCSSCHTTLPELTPLGRLFKLNGYTFTGITTITEKGGPTKAGLNINTWLPLSAFFQASYSATNKPQPGTQNGNVEFPQAASLFLAGAMSLHAGGIVQFTYNAQKDHFGLDNTDIRYANRTKLGGKELIYGVTLNNNPTVEDVWNDTPAWGFPWVATDVAPSPAAATLINGRLAQDVAGLGGYAMWNAHLYGDFTLYRSEHIGASQPNPGLGFGINIRGVAPYWRVAWQQSRGNNYVEFGTYGIHVSSTPNAVVGLKDNFTDVAADVQYERAVPWEARNDLLVVHSTYIHESSDLNATFDAKGAALVPHRLNTTKLDGVYHIGNKYAGTLGVFGTSGTADSVLYAAAPVTGSASGGPRSTGYIGNVSWWPIQNIQLGLQYTGYWRFNGGKSNYDASGRNASGNNSVYAVVWFIF
jgi:hypothetical protein